MQPLELRESWFIWVRINQLLEALLVQLRLEQIELARLWVPAHDDRRVHSRAAGPGQPVARRTWQT